MTNPQEAVDWYATHKKAEDFTEVARNEWCDKASDVRDIKKPKHYINEEGNECKDTIRTVLCKDGFLDYCRGAVIKYVWRYKDKENPIKDLKKAKQYIDMMIVELEK